MAMVQFDYDTLRTTLKNRLESKLKGRVLNNSTSMYLIDIWAEMFDEISRYGEYLLRENKWSLAQNTSSIMTQLDLFGYKPHRKKGASGNVIVSADENFTTTYQYNVFIPKFTRFSNGSLTYCSAQDVTLPNTSVYVEIPVIQGELKTTGEFLGNSFSGDIYTIENDSIENSLYELRNNGIVCTEVEWFGQSQVSVNGSESETYTYNNFEYIVKNLPDFSGIQIQFAPNSHDANDHFEFRYLVTEGKNGSCFDRYTTSTPKSGITKVLDSVTDSQGVSNKLYVRNIDENGISGGTDYETVDDMRDNAPYTFNRVDKIITHNDYVAAIRQVMPNCIFEIWTEASLKYNNEWVNINDANDFINNSKVFFSGVKYDLESRNVIPIDSSEFYDDIITKLNVKKGITDYFIINNPDIYKFYLNGKVYFDLNKISRSLLVSQISNNILEEYRVDKAQFNKPVYHSDYISLFSGISGIDHVDVNVVMYTDIDVNPLNNNFITTNKKDNFGFLTANSSEIAISGEYIFTSVDLNTGNLIKDLFMVVKESNVWEIYNADRTVKLSTNDENASAYWNNVDEGNIDTGVLGSIKIDVSKDEGKKIYYGNDDGTTTSTGNGLDVETNDLIVRFVPQNFNCTLTPDTIDQILIYSDAKGDGVSGTVDPWKKNQIRAGNNWWATESEIDKYGAGLVFIGE